MASYRTLSRRSLSRRSLVIGAALAATVALAGCAPQGGDVAAQRRSVQEMRTKTLADLYKIHPGARTRVNGAAGYAVFSNVNINLILLSAGGGWGVARERATGKDTYMRMGSAGIGLGLGVKDFRGVFVFDTKDKYDWFVNQGWDASAQADAAAKTSNQGGAWAGAVDVAPGIHLYQITEAGLALQATVQGNKFWKDGELN